MTIGALRDRTDIFRKFRQGKSLERDRRPVFSSRRIGAVGEAELVPVGPGASRLGLAGSNASAGSSDKERLLHPHAINIGPTTLPPAWVDFQDDCNARMQEINKQMLVLSGLHAKRLRVSFGVNEAQQEEEINELTYEIGQLFKQAEINVKQIGEAELKKGKETPSQDDLQMRKNVQISVASKLQDLSKKFRLEQQRYMEQLRKVQMGGEATEEHNPGAAPGVGTVGLDDFHSGGGELTQAQLQRMEINHNLVEERHTEIMQIAKSISDLHQIFKDMSVLVIEQGTIIDRIDYNVESTVESVQSGLGELEQANESAGNSKLTMCILLLMCVIGFLVILLVLKVV
eukprot:gnl/Hemi2/18230_TR6029_c0_g1_i1.p1 gnl/Hemi2/18230_TR6029_c0_g1~~gnl/Hemi2/18230_TR6029_c0_g1_i1.p1  ORF type:complete len:344 (-),score=124.24 gnl/Hemi2/18230_TR6029_c0_g1_i1:75-1106(-)